MNNVIMNKELALVGCGALASLAIGYKVLIGYGFGVVITSTEAAIVG